MTIHIDVYAVIGAADFGSATWKPEPIRQFEGQEAVEYAKTKHLPYFNGYALQTAAHEDAECEKHRPTGLVWERAPMGEDWRLPDADPYTDDEDSSVVD